MKKKKKKFKQNHLYVQLPDQFYIFNGDKIIMTVTWLV